MFIHVNHAIPLCAYIYSNTLRSQQRRGKNTLSGCMGDLAVSSMQIISVLRVMSWRLQALRHIPAKRPHACAHMVSRLACGPTYCVLQLLEADVNRGEQPIPASAEALWGPPEEGSGRDVARALFRLFASDEDVGAAHTPGGEEVGMIWRCLVVAFLSMILNNRGS